MCLLPSFQPAFALVAFPLKLSLKQLWARLNSPSCWFFFLLAEFLRSQCKIKQGCLWCRAELSNSGLWTCPGRCPPLTSLSAGTGCRMDGLGTAIMMVLRGSALIASDQSNSKVGKKKHSRINSPCNLQTRQRQRTAMVASAKGGTKATLDFSHTH